MTEPSHALSRRPTAQWRATGQWPDRTVVDCAREVMEATPERTLIVDNGEPVSARAVYDDALRLAAALARRGVGTGDVVSFQLPNWREAASVSLAAAMLGAVVNPLVPIYRDAEISFMMRDCCSKALFIPASFRRHDFVAMFARLRPALPDLETVVVLRGPAGPFSAWDELIAEAPDGFAPRAVEPDAVKLIMYTSGTTGRPKGVQHSHNTLMCELESVRELAAIGPGDAMFMASPVSHVTGCLLGLDLPWVCNIPAVFLDTWSGAAGVAAIKRHGATLTVSATPFLQELLAAALAEGERLPSLRLFACGGASVPPDLIERALNAFENCVAARVFGSTEAPTVTFGPRSKSERRVAAHTDGRIVPNFEVRIVDPAGDRPLGIGQEGEILVRGPELFLGYIRAEDNEGAFDADGYFRTGDLGHVTGDGCIVVTGRRKDLIIRGGENISPKEIEDALVSHPAVAEVAVIGAPHPRVGETVCAVVIAREGETPDVASLAAHLRAAGFAAQKWPERVEIVEALPRTASGKVRKNVLRDLFG
jgi:acyl-CoA synthetase (AMP-forming)/AMP-acid ligase II